MIFLSFISVCSLNFNKLARIKSVHQVFILKYISYLVADYEGTANLSINIGMRMPVNPGIDPAADNQVSVFAGNLASLISYNQKTHCPLSFSNMCRHINTYINIQSPSI